MPSRLCILCLCLTSFQLQAQNHIETLLQHYPQAHQTLFRNLKAKQPIPSYDFDANREPEHALKEGMGGQCNTHARVAALALMKNGVRAEDLRIVSAVNNSALDKLCENRKGLSANHTKDGLSGHVFLLLKSNNQWQLINTTTVPGTPPAKPFAPQELEMTSFHSPEKLEAMMQRGPVQIPEAVTQSLPKNIFGKMTIFHSVRPDQYPSHDFSKRKNLIASGSLNSDICRYGQAIAPERESLLHE